MYPIYNEAIAINTALYLLNKSESKSIEKVKLMKMLYFADRAHLAKYGRLITSDHYVKMTHGPVPERIYQTMKRSNIFICEDDKECKALKEADTDYLSETDIECLDATYKELYPEDTFTLAAKSHDLAWNNAEKGKKLNIKDIINETNYDEDAKEEAFEHYNDRLENELIFQ